MTPVPASLLVCESERYLTKKATFSGRTIIFGTGTVTGIGLAIQALHAKPRSSMYHEQHLQHRRSSKKYASLKTSLIQMHGQDIHGLWMVLFCTITPATWRGKRYALGKSVSM